MKVRRKRARGKKREGEIPTGSFSDIAFLLIIYFLLATSLVKVKSVTADLPSGEKTTQATTDKTPIVNLRDSEMFFNDKPVTLPELGDRLAALELHEAEASKKVIMLESTETTAYEVYFQALATISANGGVVALVEGDD